MRFRVQYNRIRFLFFGECPATIRKQLSHYVGRSHTIKYSLLKIGLDKWPDLLQFGECPAVESIGSDD